MKLLLGFDTCLFGVHLNCGGDGRCCWLMLRLFLAFLQYMYIRGVFESFGVLPACPKNMLSMY